MASTIINSSGVTFPDATVQTTAAPTGTIPVNKGGTGKTTLTANNVLLGNGTSAIQEVAPGTSGNVLQSDGTTWTSATLNSFSGMQGQIFTSSGTFTIPANITKLKVTVLGAGGNGTGGGNGNSGVPSGGAGGTGGSGGGLAWSFLTSLTPGNTIAVTVGASGGNSVVASGTQTITTITAGGNGGSVTGGQLNMQGTSGYGGGSGGGVDGSGYALGGGGSNGGNPVAFGQYGKGASGNIYAGAAGGNATGYGAGGGGGAGGGTYSTDQPGGSGGAGTQGFVMFEW